jgi:predicted transcriptional regulator
MTDEAPSLLFLTAQIIANYVDANKLAPTELPALIRTVHAALGNVGQPAAPATDAVAKPTSAQIRKSITPDALVSFEDGQPYRMLKRHLSKRGLTPAEYRAKWGLPKDYPMTAPTYSAMRSASAKANGLGAKRKGSTKTKPAAKAKPAAAKRGVGRPKKVAV